MKVLIACERSGNVRKEFRNIGHDAWSCDLVPADDQSEYHIQVDVLTILDKGWDLMIAFPPCTNLCVSGARHFKRKRESGEQQKSIDFFMALVKAPIEKLAIENPVGIMSTIYRKPTQIIRPWQFGHGETKRTCLWLKNLPMLQPTKIVQGRSDRIHFMAPSPVRAILRSITYPGIAKAMAEQWGN